MFNVNYSNLITTSQIIITLTETSRLMGEIDEIEIE